VSLVLAGCGNDSTGSKSGSSAAAPPPAASAAPSAGQATPANVVGTVTMKGGKPEGGVKRISIKAGQPAVLLVTSDMATEIHVHGADRTISVPANQQTSVDVSQTAPGSYEVEDHASDALLVQLRAT
jgi:hypothetical protein